MKSRIISGVIGLIYLIGALLCADGKTTFYIGIFLILPLTCIWFSEEMGNYSGNYSGKLMQGGPMTQSPGCLVAAMGWLLLFLPVILGLFNGFKEHS
jgi:hypothetical protein